MLSTFISTCRALPLICVIFTCISPLKGQSPSSVASYPDILGFEVRSDELLPAIKQLGYGDKGKSHAKCPDTGKSFLSYGLEGETIMSPYTGRAFRQGATGFFGPKARDEQGRIVAFGGDAMKYDLPPATAAMMLNPTDEKALQMVNIPGYLRQQFFFPAVNWTRFYGLVGKNLSNAWKDSLKVAVATYRNTLHFDATGRPSLGNLSYPHTLIGQPGEVLGGNAYDGGTENHKTMWRTSGLLYAQWFGPKSTISYTSAPEAERLISDMLKDYMARCLRTGNGEYLSSTYYPYAMMGYLNLYDFSPDISTRQLAKDQLDYYLATYALCSLDGIIAGPQRRGYLSMGEPNAMEKYMWLWSGAGPWNLSATELASKEILHPATSGYRPNKIIYNLMTKRVKLPYEVYISHPSYHLKHSNEHQEYLYMSKSFAMGSSPIHQINNPSQQVCWSLVVKDSKRPIQLGGGHPRYLFPSGHSPYSQYIQKEGAILLLTTSHDAVPPPSDLRKDRSSWFDNVAHKLRPTQWPKDSCASGWISFLKEAPERAESWFYVPKSSQKRLEKAGCLFVQFDSTYLAISPIGEARWLELPNTPQLKRWVHAHKRYRATFTHYDIWVISGAQSGFAVEAVETDAYPNLEAFAKAMLSSKRLSLRALDRKRATYNSLAGHKLEVQFEEAAMVPTARINGQRVNYSKWAKGGVYDSPYLKIKDGIMWVSDGEDSYEISY